MPTLVALASRIGSNVVSILPACWRGQDQAPASPPRFGGQRWWRVGERSSRHTRATARRQRGGCLAPGVARRVADAPSKGGRGTRGRSRSPSQRPASARRSSWQPGACRHGVCRVWAFTEAIDGGPVIVAALATHRGRGGLVSEDVGAASHVTSRTRAQGADRGRSAAPGDT